MREEIKYILTALDVKSPSAYTFKAKLLEVIDDPLALIFFADKLKQETQSTKKDFPDDRLAFYDFYLAVAWQANDTKIAKEQLSNAVHAFRIRDFALNEALGEWLFSIFHFENQKYDRAQRACETAINILQQLITRCEDESKYQKAGELKKHLAELMKFQSLLETPPVSEDPKAENNSQNGDSVKSKLQAFHNQLQKIYDSLREENKRIPPTLVAAIFYVYKTIAASHSVYSKVPPPETDREKEIYEELLEKVRFFEVVEQLVALEQEFTPMASREEMLKKINQEWDREINR
jgi:hypothetical protein